MAPGLWGYRTGEVLVQVGIDSAGNVGRSIFCQAPIGLEQVKAAVDDGPVGVVDVGGGDFGGDDRLVKSRICHDECSFNFCTGNDGCQDEEQ